MTVSRGIRSVAKEILAQVRELYIDGKKSRSDIHKILGCNIRQIERAIAKLRKETGVSVRYRAMSKDREDLKHSVCKMRADGLSVKEIADKFGITLGVAYGIVERGVGYEKRFFLDQEKEEAIRKMYDAGWTDAEICKELKWVSNNAVRAFRKRRGILGRSKSFEFRDAYIDDIRKMHFDGISDAIIAKQFGFPTELSLYHFRKRRGIVKPRLQVAPVVVVKPKPVVVFRAPKPAAKRPPHRRISIAPLMRDNVLTHAFSVRRCQYPMWGDDVTVFNEDGTPHFCGAPSEGSWCLEHRKRVFTTWERLGQQVLQQQP